MARQIQRRYFDENKWEEIPESRARDSLLRFYADFEPILKELESGETVYTNSAEYRMENADGN